MTIGSLSISLTHTGPRRRAPSSTEQSPVTHTCSSPGAYSIHLREPRGCGMPVDRSQEEWKPQGRVDFTPLVPSSRVLARCKFEGVLPSHQNLGATSLDFNHRSELFPFRTPAHGKERLAALCLSPVEDDVQELGLWRLHRPLREPSRQDGEFLARTRASAREGSAGGESRGR